MTTLRIEMDQSQLAELAERVALRLAPREDVAQGWLATPAAASYLDCSVHRVRDLVKQRRVQFAKEGGRLVFKREWLDALVIEAELR